MYEYEAYLKLITNYSENDDAPDCDDILVANWYKNEAKQSLHKGLISRDLLTIHILGSFHFYPRLIWHLSVVNLTIEASAPSAFSRVWIIFTG